MNSMSNEVIPHSDVKSAATPPMLSLHSLWQYHLSNRFSQLLLLLSLLLLLLLLLLLVCKCLKCCIMAGMLYAKCNIPFGATCIFQFSPCFVLSWFRVKLLSIFHFSQAVEEAALQPHHCAATRYWIVQGWLADSLFFWRDWSVSDLPSVWDIHNPYMWKRKQRKTQPNKTKQNQTRYYLYFQFPNDVLRCFHKKGKRADRTDLKIKRFIFAEVQIPQQPHVFQTRSQQRDSMLWVAAFTLLIFLNLAKISNLLFYLFLSQLFRASWRSQEEVLSSACCTHRTPSLPSQATACCSFSIFSSHTQFSAL